MFQLNENAKRSFLEQSLRLVPYDQLIPLEVFKLLIISKNYMATSQKHSIYRLDIKESLRFDELGRLSLRIVAANVYAKHTMGFQINSVDTTYNHLERAIGLLNPLNIGIRFGFFVSETFFDAQLQILLKTNARVSFSFMFRMNKYQFAYLTNQLPDRVSSLQLDDSNISIQDDLFQTMSLDVLELEVVQNLAQFKQLMRHKPKKMSFLTEGSGFMTETMGEQHAQFPSLIDLDLTFIGSFQHLVGTLENIRNLCPNLKKLAVDASLVHNLEAFDLPLFISALNIGYWAFLCFKRTYSAMFELRKFKVDWSLHFSRSIPLSNSLMKRFKQIISFPNSLYKISRNNVRISFDFMKQSAELEKPITLN